MGKLPVKPILGSLLLALSFLMPVGANGSHTTGGGPNQDKVDGTLEDPFPSTLHVNATSDPGGANPRGHFYYRNEGPGIPEDEVGEVTCLRVFAPNRAWVGGRIDRSKLPTFPGEGNGMLFLVIDNGEPGDNDVHGDIILPTPPTVCPASGNLIFPATHGNFIVHQAGP